MQAARLPPVSPRPFFGNKAALSQAGLVVGAHVLLLGGLLSYAPTRDAIVQIIPVVADLVPPKVIPPAPEPKPQVQPPPKREAVKVEPLKPPPKPIPEKPPEKLAPAPSPAPVAVAPAPAPVIVASPSPAAVSAPAPAPAPSPLPAPAPVSSAAAPAPAPAPPALAPYSPPNSNAAYLNNPKPEYPSAARQLQESGRVILEVLVSTQGLAERVLVKTSSGSSRLDNAALKAVRQWKFVPAKRGNEAVSGTVNVPINFNYEDE